MYLQYLIKIYFENYLYIVYNIYVALKIDISHKSYLVIRM